MTADGLAAAVGPLHGSPNPVQGIKPMLLFDLGRLATESAGKNQTWLEFLRIPSLSMGIYHLKAGQVDQQEPHTEDEIYYILSGKAWFRAGEEERAVVPGTLIFVERSVVHRFSKISEDLTMLVFFAPPEGSLQA
jgi:quercetin dioxygenase-like cupin family protein